MANRQWRVTGSFHRVSEVAVIVKAPNWQAGLRKAALAIKQLPELKGRRLNKGVFTLSEYDGVIEAISGEQVNLPVVPVAQETLQVSPITEQDNLDVSSANAQVARKLCSNPNCNQSFAHEGMCDNAPVESGEEKGVDVAEINDSRFGGTLDETGE